MDYRVDLQSRSGLPTLSSGETYYTVEYLRGSGSVQPSLRDRPFLGAVPIAEPMLLPPIGLPDCNAVAAHPVRNGNHWPAAMPDPMLVERELAQVGMRAEMTARGEMVHKGAMQREIMMAREPILQSEVQPGSQRLRGNTEQSPMPLKVEIKAQKDHMNTKLDAKSQKKLRGKDLGLKVQRKRMKGKPKRSLSEAPCFYCKEHGHKKADCPKRSENNSDKMLTASNVESKVESKSQKEHMNTKLNAKAHKKHTKKEHALKVQGKHMKGKYKQSLSEAPCFHCNEQGHKKADCPKRSEKKSDQGMPPISTLING